MSDNEVKKEVEKFRVHGIILSDLLCEKFKKILKDNGMEAFPIFMFLDVKSENDIVTLSHQNPKEFEDKIVHIEARTTRTLDKFAKLLEDMKK